MNRKIKDLAKAKDLNQMELSPRRDEDKQSFDDNIRKLELPNDNSEKREEKVEVKNKDKEDKNDKSEQKASFEWLKKDLDLFSISVPFWKWLVLMAVLAALIVVFYFLGFFMSSKKIVVAAGDISKEDNSIFGEHLAAEYTIGRSPNQVDTLDIRARGALIVDAKSGSEIAGLDPERKLPIASLTKVVTANVALRYWEPDDELMITVEVDPDVESSAELRKGDNYKVEDLVEALLIQSAAEAGYTFADSYPGGRDGFVKDMNEFCDEYGLEDTRFVDPVGIDRQNISTARDLSRITRLSLQNPTIKDAVSEKENQICSLSGQCTKLQNTNELLENPSYKGVKTGYTVAAGPCLIAYHEDDEGELIMVLLNAYDRFETAEKEIRRLK